MLRLGLIAGLLGAVTLTACYSTSDGVAPPVERFYFPVGVTLDGDARHLFVVNSDFDLQFDSGTLQSLDLERLRSLLPIRCNDDGDCASGRACDAALGWCVQPDAEDPCAPLEAASSADRITVPGPCSAVDLVSPHDGGGSLITDVVKIGAFATDVLYRPRPANAPDGPSGRLFVPVRADTTMHWIDTQNGSLDCGQNRNQGGCDDRHRRGDDPSEENTRDLTLTKEPFAIDATEDGRAIAVTHQTEGAVSLFVNDWSNTGPTLQFTSGGVPSRPVGIAALPQPALTRLQNVEYQPGFLVAFRNAAEVYLFRFFDDEYFDAGGANPARPFLSPVARASIQANALGDDSRAIAVDSVERKAAERACLEAAGLDPSCLEESSCGQPDTALLGCLQQAAEVPLGTYVANRSPASVLVGRSVNDAASITDEVPAFHSSLPLPLGPSRVVTGTVIDANGDLVPRVFILCFDSQYLIIYDPKSARIESQIRTGRGPQALAIDPEHGLGYLAHFTDSYLSVISLDQRFLQSYGEVLANIGQPTAPRASK